MLRTRTLATTRTTFVLALAFAAIAALVARGELFVSALRVDPDRPAPVTLRLAPMRMARSAEHPEQGIRPLALRVPIGATVDDPVEATLVRAREAARRPPRADHMAGLFVLYFLVVLAMLNWLRTLSPARGALVRTQVGLLGLLMAFMVTTKGVFLFTPLATTLVPVAMLSLWTRAFLDRRTAAMIAFVTSLLVASLADFDPVAALVLLTSGLVPAMLFEDLKRPLTLLPVSLAGGVAAVAAYAASSVVFVNYFDLFEELADPAASDLIGAFVGGPLAGLCAYFLYGIAARCLGAVSRARLLELTDLEQPLLRRMATGAPGSWEHARAMANLAEAAVSAIRGDALLTRVGAYYHDLGKTIQSKFFVENLARGELTPHTGLDPDVSADAIMAHVVEGTNILRRGGIPEPVIEFAYTHHGTSVIEYFWHRCVEAGNPKGLSESFFRYPGMRPRTKETAILMLVDSIEAASRTIQRIIFVKLKQGQLDESGLTPEDLRIITNQLADTLCNVHHSRIRYPWQDRKEGDKSLPIPGAATQAEVVAAREADERARAEERGERSTTHRVPREPTSSDVDDVESMESDAIVGDDDDSEE